MEWQIVLAAKVLAAGVCTVGVGGASIGIGIVFGGLLIAVSRNPELESNLFRTALLGFALSEAMGLLVLMMSFLIMYT